MADNYLERQQEALEQRKAGKRVLTPAQRKRFYTRPVVTKTHEQQQAEIAQLLRKLSALSHLCSNRWH